MRLRRPQRRVLHRQIDGLSNARPVSIFQHRKYGEEGHKGPRDVSGRDAKLDRRSIDFCQVHKSGHGLNNGIKGRPPRVDRIRAESRNSTID